MEKLKYLDSCGLAIVCGVNKKAGLFDQVEVEA
jgi:hypothetical protein